MAKQTGFLKITGTLGDITFYELDGEFYARKKSSLDGKRVKRDPRFRRTMEEAGEFGKASKAAREVYRQLPEEQRGHGVFGRLTGSIRKLMREGKNAEEAKMQLMKELGAVEVTLAQQDVPTNSQPDDFAEQLLKQVFEFSGKTTPHAKVLQRIQRQAVIGQHKDKTVVVLNNGDGEHEW